jgi:hypothetical protein
MTQVETTLRSAYLAGPMRGIEEFNLPAFAGAAAALRAKNWEVFSPAERDERDEEAMAAHREARESGDWSSALPLAYYMAHDLKAVCRHDALILLDGWEQSQGARLEAVVAVEIGHPVFLYNEGARLTSLDVGYVADVFSCHQVGALPAEGYTVDLQGAIDALPYEAGDTGDLPEEVERGLGKLFSEPPVFTRHPNSERFHRFLKEAGELHDSKQADYGRGDDPFANVRGSEEWGVRGWLGAMVRANDKIRRLQTYARTGSLKNEGVVDSFMDLAVYALIARVLFEQEQEEA